MNHKCKKCVKAIKSATPKCYCCKLNDMHFKTFQCGFVINEKNGGTATVDNLRPICTSCDQQLSNEILSEFMERIKP